MSILLTSTGLTSAPREAAAVAIQQNAGAWTFDDWSEVIAEADGTLYVAGVNLTNDGAWAALQAEFDVGIGAVGEEVSLGSVIRIHGPNSAQGANFDFLLPVPFGTIPIGSRVCLRMRSKIASVDPVYTSLLYYKDLEAGVDYADSSATPLTCLPYGADSVDVTPNATPWDNSSIVEVDAGEGIAIAIAGLAMSNNVADTDIEYDIMVGAAAAETVLTTLRASTMARTGGALNFAMLPFLIPVPASTRISVRTRQSSTDTSNHHLIALLVYQIDLTNGTIVVNKITTPASVTEYTFTATNLTPTSFTLAHGESQSFADLTPGSGFAIVETAADGVLVTYTVSNGSPHNNITVAAGETVTVTVRNYAAASSTGDPLWKLFRFDMKISRAESD